MNSNVNKMSVSSCKDIFLDHKTQGELDAVWKIFEELCYNTNTQINLGLIQKCQAKPNDFGFYTIVPRKAVFNCSNKLFMKIRKEIMKESERRRNAVGQILTIYYGFTAWFWGWNLLPYVFTMTAFSVKPSTLQIAWILLVLLLSYVEVVFAEKAWINLKADTLLGKTTYRLLLLGFCSCANGFLETSNGLPLLIFIWSFSAAVRSALNLLKYSVISNWILQNDAFLEGVIRPGIIISGLQIHFFKFSLPVCSISEIWCCQELLLTFKLGTFLSTMALMAIYSTFCVVYFTIYTIYSEEAYEKSKF